MVQINFARKEINCKLVYYGPGLSGKTTNLEMVHARTPEGNRGELTSISTDGDRTLFFDFMPLDLGEISGMKTKFHLYTVPGQVYYNSTRKLVLLGADGVIFIADSSAAQLKENLESLNNLRENLLEMGKDFTKFPVVLQWNKRDVSDAMPIEDLARELNPLGFPAFEAIANKGDGVFPTLKALAQLVLANINSAEGNRSSAAASGNASAAGAKDEKKTEASGGDKSGKSAGKPSTRPSAPTPAGGGLKIERNEINIGPTSAPAPAKTPALEPALNAAASLNRPGPMTRKPGPSAAPTSPRPPVASNPLDELSSMRPAGGNASPQRSPMQPASAMQSARTSPQQGAGSAVAERSRPAIDPPRQAPPAAPRMTAPNTAPAPSPTSSQSLAQRATSMMDETRVDSSKGAGASAGELAGKRGGADAQWSQDNQANNVFKREMRVIGGRPGGAPSGSLDTRKVMTIGVICGVVTAVIALVLFKLFSK